MITYFRGKNHISKKRYKILKTLNIILVSVDEIVKTGATSTSFTLSITSVGMIILLISAGIACTLSLGNEVLHNIIIDKNF